MEALRLVLGCVGRAIALGIAVNLVTAHVAVEYFSVHHPKLIDQETPLAMALVWGVVATWWAGLICGLLLAFTNHRLRAPVAVREVLRMVTVGCVAIWFVMMLVLLGAYLLSGLVPTAERQTTFEHDRRLIAVALAHAAEYLFAGIATLAVAIRMRAVSRQQARGHKGT